MPEAAGHVVDEGRVVAQRVIFEESHATVPTRPERSTLPGLRYPDTYPWVSRLDEVKVYFDDPVVID